MIDARRAGQREVSIHCVVADFPTPCAIMLNLERPHIARLPALQERHRHRSARRPCSRGNDSMLTARIMIRKLLTKHWEQIRAFRIGPTPLAKPIIMTFKQDPFLLPGLIIRHRPHRKNGTGHRLKKHMPRPLLITVAYVQTTDVPGEITYVTTTSRACCSSLILTSRHRDSP